MWRTRLPSAWRHGFFGKILDFFKFPAAILDFLDFLPRAWRLILPRNPTILMILARNPRSCHRTSEKKFRCPIGPRTFKNTNWVIKTLTLSLISHEISILLYHKTKKEVFWKDNLYPNKWKTHILRTKTEVLLRATCSVFLFHKFASVLERKKT